MCILPDNPVIIVLNRIYVSPFIHQKLALFDICMYDCMLYYSQLNFVCVTQ